MGLNLSSIGKKLHQYEGAIGNFFGGAVHGAEQVVGNTVHGALDPNNVPNTFLRGVQKGAGQATANTIGDIAKIVQPVVFPQLNKIQSNPLVSQKLNQVQDFGSRNYQAPKPGLESAGYVTGGGLAEIPKLAVGGAGGLFGRTAGEALTTGLGAGRIATPLIKSAAESTGFTVPYDVASGRTSPKQIVQDIGLNTGGDIALRGAVKGVQVAAPAIRDAYKSTPYIGQGESGFLGSNPRVTALNDKAKQLNQQRDKLLASGKSESHSSVKANDRAYKAVVKLRNDINQRGSVPVDPLAEALGLDKTPSPSIPRTFEEQAASTAQALRNSITRTGAEGMSPEAKAATRVAISRKNAPQIKSAQLPSVAPGDVAQARLNSRAARGAIAARVTPAIDAANKLSPADHALLDATRTTPAEQLASKAENPRAFLDAAQKAKEYNDFTHALGTNQGQLLGYRQNYGAPLLYNLEDQGTQDALTQYQATLRRTPGYAKSRTTPDYATGATLGLQRLNKNFAEDLAHDANNRASHISELTLANGLQQAFPGKVAIGEIPRGYTQLQVANGKAISVPNEIAAKINNRAKAPDVNNLALRGYDAANRGLKYSSLGGGTFHALTTLETTAGQQVFSGNLIRHPIQNLRLIAGTLSRRAHDLNMAQLAQDVDKTGLSTLDKARIGGVTLTPQEILGDVNVNILNKAGSRLNFIKNVHDMVFQRQIPEAKLMIFKQVTKNLDPSTPADLAKIRGAASAVNNLGGINRAIEGLTPKQAQQTARFVLATDFTETKFRKLADALTKGGPQGNIARQMVLGKIVVTALPGIAVAAAAGKLNSAEDYAKEAAKQILDPQVATGFKSDKGYSKIAKLPGTEVSELGRILLPLFQDGNMSDKLSGAQHYVTGRASAGASTIFSLLTNKDYFGNPVVAQDSEGKVDVGKTVQNLTLSKGPIPIQQSIKAATGKESVGEAIVNTLGPRVVVDPNDPKYKDVSDYFKGRDKFVRDLNPNEQALFNKINPVKKDTNGQSILDKNSYTTPSNYEDLLANPQFASKYRSYQQSQPSHDPLWDLPQDQLRAYMQATIISKNDPGGDSATTRQLYAKVPQSFFDARSAYFDNLKASGVDLGVSTTSQKPKMPQELVDFSANYQNLPYGTGARSAALRSPQGQAYIAYLDQNKIYNNQERADLGLPPLEDTSSQYSRYGSGGKKKITVSPGVPKAFVSKVSSGAPLKTPKARLAKGKSAKLAIAKTGKASVKLKRSRV